VRGHDISRIYECFVVPLPFRTPVAGTIDCVCPVGVPHPSFDRSRPRRVRVGAVRSWGRSSQSGSDRAHRESLGMAGEAIGWRTSHRVRSPLWYRPLVPRRGARGPPFSRPATSTLRAVGVGSLASLVVSAAESANSAVDSIARLGRPKSLTKPSSFPASLPSLDGVGLSEPCSGPRS